MLGFTNVGEIVEQLFYVLSHAGHSYTNNHGLPQLYNGLQLIRTKAYNIEKYF